MKQIFRIFTLIAVAMLTAGQAWAGTVELGKIIYTQGDNDGGALEFYEDVACNNKITLTNGKSSALSVGTVYIKAKPEFDSMFEVAEEGSTVTFITAEVTAGTGAAGARTRNGEANIEVGGFIDVTATATKGVYQITMPADENFNVTLTATFPEKVYRTGVNYIDIDGQTKQTEAYVLDGTEEVLGEPGGTSSSPKETWYVCDKNLSYTTFNFSSNCNVNIILADNVEMSVINSNGDAINNSNYSSPDSQDSFGVYGQSKGSDRGALTVKCTSSGGNAIDITGGVIISHCNLTAEGDAYGIYAKGSGKDVTIRDAKVTANAGTYGFAIYSSNGGVSITGGTVTAESGSFGIRADGSGKDVTIIGAEVIANATATGGYAIYSDYGGVSITGGTVTAEGDVFGIRANGSGKDVTITGAEVTANAGTGGFAIYSSNGGVSITGGTVTAESDYFGIRANGSGKDVTISGAEVNAIATDGFAIDSSNGGISITGSTVIAEGVYCGIRAQGSDKDVTISGAEVKATGTNDSAIRSIYGGVSITGGTVIAESKYFGIYAQGSGKNVTISGAKVTATATDDSAIRSYYGGVSITGGTVIADGIKGITSSDDIILGWTSADDYIYATSYSVTGSHSVKIAEGKHFVAYTPSGTPGTEGFDPSVTDNTANFIVSGSSDNNFTLAAIAGKTLKPTTVTLNEGNGNGDVITLLEGETSIIVASLDYDRTLTAPGSGSGDVTIDNTPAKLYTTCQPEGWEKETGVKYYTLSSVSGSTLHFSEIDGDPQADTPYLVAVTGNSNVTEHVTGNNVTLKKIVTGSSTSDGSYTMMGTQTGLTNSDAISAASGSGNATYILQTGSTWGKVTDADPTTVYIPPFRAYITGPDVTTTSGARELNSSFDGEAAGIDTLRLTDSDGTEHWYDLNGRRIEKPTRKGVFIHGGRKEVIR